jgi:hypothetical protein
MTKYLAFPPPSSAKGEGTSLPRIYQHQWVSNTLNVLYLSSHLMHYHGKSLMAPTDR